MATWEYVGRSTTQKSLIVRKTLSRNAGQYGDTYVYDVERPEVTHTLETTEGLSDSEADALHALAATWGSQTTVTDAAGRNWSGRIVQFSTERVPGSELWLGNLTLRPTDDEP